jgi:hypothetical protein
MPFSVALLCTMLGVLTHNVQAQDPTPDPSDAINSPTSVSHFDYVGCLSISLSAFTSANEDEDSLFRQVEHWEFMSINQCISDCYHAAYAAVHNEYVHKPQLFLHITADMAVLLGHAIAPSPPTPQTSPYPPPSTIQLAPSPVPETQSKHVAVP